MPGAPLPLHIFEERYKQMVNECLEQEGEFGMVFADESGTRQVGCTAKIVELVERYEDGRMLILVEGSRRFKLNNVLTGKPYYVGEIEYFQDEPEEDVGTLAEESIDLFRSEFGMVFADESGTRQVGCTAKIVELVERYEDGRMLILVEGSRRFKLNNVLTGKPYYVGEIEYFQDEPEEDVGTLAEECIALLERVVEAATEGSVGIEIEPPYRNLSFAIAGRVEFEPAVRQQILELTSEQQRLQKVKELLGAAAERLERERQTREKAQTNGHLRGDWQPGG